MSETLREIEASWRRQRDFFASGATRELDARRRVLKRFKEVLVRFEPRFLEALRLDLGKPEFEAYASEIGFLYTDIDETLRNLAKWAKPKRVSTPLVQKPGKSLIYAEPRGLVLILAPWNYPVQLLLSPLVGAIAAGNAVMLKPSELAPHCSAVLKDFVAETFDPAWVHLFEGGAEVAQGLLELRFDHVFFTGSTKLGRVVAQAAARHLTPVTLELGGKSPCLIDEGVPLDVGARRIVWGKFFNAGQTCVAPDYLLVPKAEMEVWKRALASELREALGEDPALSPDYARVVNDKHFDRLEGLLEGASIVIGGRRDRATRYFEPTIVEGLAPDSALLHDEIFGPILPLVPYETLEEALRFVADRPQPLAFYLFTKRSNVEREVLARVSFGGGCVNDTILHVANPQLPFGGVGESGMGRYHGRYSFATFSHFKGVIHKPFAMDPVFRYRPYAKRIGLIRKMLK